MGQPPERSHPKAGARRAAARCSIRRWTRMGVIAGGRLGRAGAWGWAATRCSATVRTPFRWSRPTAGPVRVQAGQPRRHAMVIGADEQIMGGNGHGQADAVAPAPEAPAPQALRAQIEAETTPDAPPSRPPEQPIAPAAQPVSLSTPAQRHRRPCSAMPEQRVTAASRQPPSGRPRTPAAIAGRRLRRCSLRRWIRTEGGRGAEWQRLSHAHAGAAGQPSARGATGGA